MQAKEKQTYQQKMPNHEHGLPWDMDPVRKLLPVLIQWIVIKNGKHFGMLVQYRHQLLSFLSGQSALYAVAKPPANRHAADQIDARAKKRPASGVTVIEVPKTAET